MPNYIDQVGRKEGGEQDLERDKEGLGRGVGGGQERLRERWRDGNEGRGDVMESMTSHVQTRCNVRVKKNPRAQPWGGGGGGIIIVNHYYGI